MKRKTVGLIGGLAVAAFATVGAWAAQDAAPVAPFPAAIADPNAVQTVEVRDGAGGVVLSGSFGAAVQKQSGMERLATLTASGGAATGTAEIEVSSATPSARELDVDIDDLAPSTQYRLLIDEVEIAVFTTDAGGDAELEFGEDDLR